MATPITTVDQATQAGTYDAQNGPGSYTNLPTGGSSSLSLTNIDSGSGTGITPTVSPETLALVGKVKVPPVVPLTAAPALAGTIDTQAKQYGQSVVDQAQIDAEKAKNADLNTQIQSTFDTLGTKGAATEAAYQAEGVDTAQQNLTDINNQILAEQNSLNHAKESIYGATGVSREQANQNFSEVQRESLGKQADLSVIQYAAQNKYSDAKSIADRKIEMQFEPLQNKLDALKFFYQDNKDSLSKDEDKQFQATITERSRLLTDWKEAAKSLQDTKLTAIKEAQESGAPVSILQAIQSAATPEDVRIAQGQYQGLDSSYKRAQIAKIYSDIAGTGSGASILSSNDIKSTKYGQQFIDVSSYKGTDLKTAVAEANRAGVPVIKDAKDANALDSLNTALNNLGELETQFNQLAPQSALTRAGTKLTRPFGAIFDTDYASKLNAYQSNREALIQQINALSGSTPRINKQELDLAVQALPKLDYTNTDTLKDGANKLALTKQYLTNSQDSILGIKTTPNQIKYGGMSLQNYYTQATPEQKAAVDAAITKFPNYSQDEIMQIITQ